MSSAPCPYCDKMPDIELRNPEIREEREIVLICHDCGLEIGHRRREKAFFEWDKNYREVKQFDYMEE